MLKFLVLADFHYKKGMYTTTVGDMEAILDRAAAEKVDFVVQLGDLCNDYLGSPELIRAYLRNRHGLKVYGVMGNHELESEGNSLDVVIPQLCNQPVNFAGAQKGYWFTDWNEYRLIALDTNHSYNEKLGLWEHYPTNSVGHPAGNIYPHALGPDQLNWLDEILADADEKGQTCIIFTHATLAGRWDETPDADAFQAILRKHPNRVLTVMNGHNHKDHHAIIDNVLYVDFNTVRNGRWRLEDAHHYPDTLIYNLENYDSEGNPTGITPTPLNSLDQAINTWFFQDPLSAIVTIDGKTVTVKGQKTQWIYGIAPPNPPDGCIPQITDLQFTLQ